MEVKELVKALLCCTGSPRIKDCKERCRYFRGGNMNKCIPDMGKDVASALESMQEELDRVKAERDAAVKDISEIIGDIEEIRRGYGVDNADADNAFADLCGNYCSNNGHRCYEESEKYRCKHFKWRGLEGRTSHE